MINIITGILIDLIVLAVTYPLASLVSGADDIIDRCESMKKWAKDMMEGQDD